MNNAYDVNQALQNLFQMRNSGQNPQQLLNTMIQQNPQMQQRLAMLQNMSRGKNPQEFIVQLARQNGVSEQNIQQLMQMIGK